MPSIAAQYAHLPVSEIVSEVRAHLSDHNTLIVKAPTGAGKSTLLPLALMDLDFLEGQKIIMLEPRRLAAKTLAIRMAHMLGEQIGESVGYRIRFEQRVGPNTRLEVVTEGILTRMLQDDYALEGVGMVIFDEFHERSIHADLALALSRESQDVLRTDLRLLIMSATLELGELSKMLKAPVVESRGRQYPVEIEHLGDADPYMLHELCASAVMKAYKEEKGDILVFLPGQGEILKCEQLIKSMGTDLRVHTLYGMMPGGKQMAALLPDKEGRRKVVLATNIAQTSLTIEGIKVVIDSGYVKAARYNPNSGLSRLETMRIAKDAADQRKGRAGRLEAGKCYRLWSLANENRMEPTTAPEIEHADLSALVLDLLTWGIQNPRELKWVSLPPKGHYAQAYELLEELGAHEEGHITQHGRDIQQLAAHPRIAHMMLKAKEEGLLPLACDIAALLEERDPLGKEAGIDINVRIAGLRRYRSEGAGNKRFRNIVKIAEQHHKLFGIKPDNFGVDDFETGLLLAHAYPERIAFARPGNNAQFQLANGRIAAAGHRDDLAHESWLAVAHIDERDGLGKIFLASPLDPKDLAPMVKERERIAWDPQEEEVVARKELRIGSIILKSTPIQHPDPEQIKTALLDAVKKEGKKWLDWDENIVQWQNRVMSLKKWNPEMNWPDVSDKALLKSCKIWLAPYLDNCKRIEDLKRIDLKEVLQYSLDMELQEQLTLLAPEHIKVPSGSNIKLQYNEDGAPPVLSVRLQECFGLTDTPSVNNGRMKVLMHLLSPGYKVVQVTGDLKSFWDSTYFEVKKELKRRYPKHAWPDKPMEQQALRGVPRRK